MSIIITEKYVKRFMEISPLRLWLFWECFITHMHVIVFFVMQIFGLSQKDVTFGLRVSGISFDWELSVVGYPTNQSCDVACQDFWPSFLFQPLHNVLKRNNKIGGYKFYAQWV